ncbi:MAG: SPOR domain-containing protein [Bacteroidota bacterium]
MLRLLAFGLLLTALPVAAQDDVSINASEQARAVRYDPGATGHATASGEPYNPERTTLAHPTLPFGTLVDLTNPANGETVTVRVNDRVPAPDRPSVRVSARAADRLGLGARGGDVVLRLGEDELALLRVRALREKERAQAEGASPPVAQAASRGFTVQLASFSDEGRAAARADDLRGAWVLPVTVDGARVYRVCYGVFPTAESAAAGQARLAARGIDGFVKSLDAPPSRTTSESGRL